MTGCVLIPIGRERKLQFGITFFQDYCHSYVLEALYLLSYPLTGYMFVRCAYALLYFVSHVKFQVYTMLDIIEQISVGYQRKSDTELLDCPEYQEVVKARLCVMVTKLTQLTRYEIKMWTIIIIIKKRYFCRVATRASATLTTHLIPPLAISGLLMGLSAMSFVYLVSDRTFTPYSFRVNLNMTHDFREIYSVTGVIFKISCGALVQCRLW